MPTPNSTNMLNLYVAILIFRTVTKRELIIHNVIKAILGSLAVYCFSASQYFSAFKQLYPMLTLREIKLYSTKRMQIGFKILTMKTFMFSSHGSFLQS